MVFSNTVYDRLMWIAQYFLPALTTLWIALAKVWGLPYGTEIGATLSALDLFLGALLGLSDKNYKGDGTMTINTSDPEKDVYTLELNSDVEALGDKKRITFVVDSEKRE